MATALSAAACTSDNGGVGTTTEAVYHLVADGIFGSDEGGRDSATKIERKMAADLPYASIGVTIDDNPQFLFVLAKQSANGDLYTLGYQISVVLRQGRVIRTQGLTKDVLGGRWEGEDIIRTAMSSGGPVSGVRWMETADRGIYTHEVRCTAQAVGDETVTVLDVKIPTRHVREECKMPDLKWIFTNHFWIGADGVIWASVQNIHPKVTPLVIEQFRPAKPFEAEPTG